MEQLSQFAQRLATVPRPPPTASEKASVFCINTPEQKRHLMQSPEFGGEMQVDAGAPLAASILPMPPCLPALGSETCDAAQTDHLQPSHTEQTAWRSLQAAAATEQPTLQAYQNAMFSPFHQQHGLVNAFPVTNTQNDAYQSGVALPAAAPQVLVLGGNSQLEAPRDFQAPLQSSLSSSPSQALAPFAKTKPARNVREAPYPTMDHEEQATVDDLSPTAKVERSTASDPLTTLGL